MSLAQAPYAPPREGLGIATGLALGLGIVAVLGMFGLVVYLLVRKDSGSPVFFGDLAGTHPSLLSSPAPQRMHLEVPPPLPAPFLQTEDTFLRTVSLPSLTDLNSEAVPVAKAPKHTAMDVELRVLGPAGSFAAFSYDASELNMPDLGTRPSGYTIVIPTGTVGSPAVLMLQRGQTLYGKASSLHVVVSVISRKAVSAA